jgi:hypothetical protein
LTGWPEEIMYPSLNFIDFARWALSFPLTITWKTEYFSILKAKVRSDQNNFRYSAVIYLTALSTALHYKPWNTIACPGDEKWIILVIFSRHAQMKHKKSIQKVGLETLKSLNSLSSQWN